MRLTGRGPTNSALPQDQGRVSTTVCRPAFVPTRLRAQWGRRAALTTRGQVGATWPAFGGLVRHVFRLPSAPDGVTRLCKPPCSAAAGPVLPRSRPHLGPRCVRRWHVRRWEPRPKVSQSEAIPFSARQLLHPVVSWPVAAPSHCWTMSPTYEDSLQR